MSFPADNTSAGITGDAPAFRVSAMPAISFTRLFRMRKRSVVPAALKLILIAVLGIPGSIAEETYSEYQVKAVFLLNFARYVDWPPDAFQSASEPLTICIWEPDPFGASIDEAALRQTAVGRTVEIRRISTSKDVGHCRVLYVRSYGLHAGPYPGQQRYVLTVSEKGSDFSTQSAINFIRDHGRIHFEIDLPAVIDAGLKIRSPLLGLATTVKK